MALWSQTKAIGQWCREKLYNGITWVSTKLGFYKSEEQLDELRPIKIISSSKRDTANNSDEDGEAILASGQRAEHSGSYSLSLSASGRDNLSSSYSQRRNANFEAEDQHSSSCTQTILGQLLPSFTSPQKPDVWSFGPIASLLLGTFNHFLLILPNAGFNMLLYLVSLINVAVDLCEKFVGEAACEEDQADFTYIFLILLIPFVINTYFSYAGPSDRRTIGHLSNLTTILEKNWFIKGFYNYLISPIAALTKVSIQALSFGALLNPLLDFTSDIIFGKVYLKANFAVSMLAALVVAIGSLPTVFSFFSPGTFANSDPKTWKKMTAAAYSTIVASLLLYNQYSTQEDSENWQLGFSTENIAPDIVFLCGIVGTLYNILADYFTYKNLLHNGYSTDERNHSFWVTNRTKVWCLIASIASLYKGIIQGSATFIVARNLDLSLWLAAMFGLWSLGSGAGSFFLFSANGKLTLTEERLEALTDALDNEDGDLEEHNHGDSSSCCFSRR